MKFTVIDKRTYKVIYQTQANHRMSTDDLLNLFAPEDWKEQVNTNEEGYFEMDGKEYYYDDIDTADPIDETIIALIDAGHTLAEAKKIAEDGSFAISLEYINRGLYDNTYFSGDDGAKLREAIKNHDDVHADIEFGFVGCDEYVIIRVL